MKKIVLATIICSVAFAEVGNFKKIIDGDTIDIGKDRCRLAYIDTPESKVNERLKRKLESCNGVTVETMVQAGESSKKHLSKYLSRGTSYKYEVISKDRYGRSVCEVYSNGELINLKMVAEGYAVPYFQYIPENKKSLFRKASQEAKKNNNGLYKLNLSAIKCIE